MKQKFLFGFYPMNSRLRVPSSIELLLFISSFSFICISSREAFSEQLIVKDFFLLL